VNPKRKFCTNDRGQSRKKSDRNRIIMHIDMDAFFAAIEQAHDPHLQNKPVIVGGSPEGRGVVTTCSYEARKFGIHSAMSSYEAVKKCPHGLFVNISSNKYTAISMEIMKILNDYSPQVEPFSVDEAFLDITKTSKRYGGAENLAREVKARILESQHITSSVGISAVRFVAKMASGVDKPDGLTIIEPGKEKEFLWDQPIGNLWGVGPKSREIFLTLGVNTIGDLAKYPQHLLKKQFGIVGESLQQMANGTGNDEISMTHQEREEKSMGHENTFNQDVTDPDHLFGMLLHLCEKVSRRLRHSGCQGRTITLKIKFSDRKLLTRARTINHATDSDVMIFNIARKLLMGNKFNERPVRLIGVSVSKLKVETESPQQELLTDPCDKLNRIDDVIDSVKSRFGDYSITRAGSQIAINRRY